MCPRTKICLCFLMCGVSYLNAQEKLRIDLAALLIPDSLTSRADAVVRFDRTTVDYLSIDKCKVVREVAITVLNQRAEHYLVFREYYKASSSKISHIQLSYYDQSGQLLRAIKEKDIEDYAAQNSPQYITDGRIKYFSYTPVSYPVTIYYTFEEENKTTLSLESWQPIPGYNIGVQSSDYTLKAFPEAKLFVKEMNIAEFNIQRPSDFEYHLSDQKPLKREVYSPHSTEIFPMVAFRPEEFVYEGKKGEFRDWDDFGNWIYSSFLNNKNDLDSKKTVSDVKQQFNIEGLSGRELISVLYQYLKNNMRYIFIGLEEGGLEPLSAGKVHQLKYGDCKALSFYMKSLLGIFDIASDYVVVHSGSNDKIGPLDDFPSTWPGNHVIVHVPNNGDTVWLECTSNDAPAGHLGSFTDDRQVVLIKESGGQLWRTPGYNTADNLTQKDAKIQLGESGDVVAEVSVLLAGINYDQIIGLSKLSSDDLIKVLKENILPELINVQIDQTNIKREEKSQIYGEINYVFSASGYGQINGEYIFLPNDFEEMDCPKLPKDSKRKYPIEFLRGQTTKHNNHYILPKEYQFSLEDVNIEIKTPYGRYLKEYDFDVVTNTLSVKRELMYHKGQYPVSEYASIKNFFDKVIKAESEKTFVQKRKT